MATFDEFRRLFTDRPYLRHGLQRGIGVEHELLLVCEDGSMGDALRVVNDLSKESGWRAENDKFQPDLLIAAKHGLLGMMTVDAGKGTLEWVSPRFPNLHDLDRATRRMQNILVRVAARSEQYVLGVGMQPLTPASHKLLIPKNRYQLFLDRFGKQAFGGFSVNASLQASVDARNPPDLHELTMDMQALSGPLIALTANSPIAGAVRSGKLASRFDVWNNYAEPDRIGILATRPGDLEAYLRHLWELEYVFGPNGNGGHQLFRRRFSECAADFNGDLRTHATYHRSCGWFDARACFEGDTSAYVESRQPCQQPQDLQTSVAALILGLAENPRGRRELIDAVPWIEWRKARNTAATHGPDGAFCHGTLNNILVGVVEAAHEGIVRRGLGEVDFLAPFFKRIMSGDGPPAFAQIAAFEKGGIPELVEQFRFREI